MIKMRDNNYVRLLKNGKVQISLGKFFENRKKNPCCQPWWLLTETQQNSLWYGSDIAFIKRT